MPMFTIAAGPGHVVGRHLSAVPARPTRRDADPPGPWPVPEERRTVSVLFADIVGSTGLVDRLDPEDVRAMQRAYFDTVAGVLGRWHGVVEKYIGDAVMALFGATESDGFDAYRAVRAGLEIQRSLDRRSLLGGPALRVRVGVATGEAVVDLTATRDGGHGAASGAVITLAARLQEYAPPGGVALCAATHRATDSLIDQRPVPPVAVAGKALPLDVWHATGPARRPHVRHTGPLIGRRRELATARDQIVRAVQERRPRWVSVTGPAGSGRSRLLHELVRAVPTVDGVAVRWCVAICPPYPEQALAPVADQVRAFAGIGVRDAPEVVRARLTAALSDLVPAARRTEAVYALEGLLAGPDAGSDARRGAAVWQECLLGLAERQPVVVAVDDLDRGAPELGHFLHRLLAAARIRALPLAVVALHGPDWTHARPVSGRGRFRVPLRRLSTVESGRLLRHLLHRAGRPVPLAATLLPLVAGNPGRAAAYVASLAVGAAGAVRLPVPEPVRRTLDARLDRLDGPQRAVLMVAAAVGAPVDAATVDRALAWTSGRSVAALRELATRELLVPRPGGYAVADPVVAAVAAARLTRAARADVLARADLCIDADVASSAQPAVRVWPGAATGTPDHPLPATRTAAPAQPLPARTPGPAQSLPATATPAPAHPLPARTAAPAQSLPATATPAPAHPLPARTAAPAQSLPAGTPARPGPGGSTAAPLRTVASPPAGGAPAPGAGPRSGSAVGRPVAGTTGPVWRRGAGSASARSGRSTVHSTGATAPPRSAAAPSRSADAPSRSAAASSRSAGRPARRNPDDVLDPRPTSGRHGLAGLRPDIPDPRRRVTAQAA